MSTVDADKGLMSLKGRPIKEAIRVLGYPDSESEIAGEKVYTWRTSHNQSYTTPQVAQTSGTVGGTPVYGTTTYTSEETINLHCTIKLATDQNHVITAAEYSGNNGGCRPYMVRLAEYWRSQSGE